MRLLSLLTGYVAGLAIAMKVRKDAGQSKLDSSDLSKSSLDKFVDEVKDIHTTTYHNLKSAIVPHISDIKNWHDLQTKITSWINNLSTEAKQYLTSLQEHGATKNKDIHTKIDTCSEEKSAPLDKTKAQGEILAHNAKNTVTTWIDRARAQLTNLRNNVKQNIHGDNNIKKDSPKKSTSHKTSTKKS